MRTSRAIGVGFALTLGLAGATTAFGGAAQAHGFTPAGSCQEDGTFKATLSMHDYPDGAKGVVYVDGVVKLSIDGNGTASATLTDGSAGHTAHLVITSPDNQHTDDESGTVPTCPQPAPPSTTAPAPPPTTTPATTTPGTDAPPATDGTTTTVAACLPPNVTFEDGSCGTPYPDAPSTTVAGPTTTAAAVVVVDDSTPPAPAAPAPAAPAPPPVDHSCTNINPATGYGTHADDGSTCHRCDTLALDGTVIPFDASKVAYTDDGDGSFTCAGLFAPASALAAPDNVSAAPVAAAVVPAAALPSGELPVTGSSTAREMMIGGLVFAGGVTLICASLRRKVRSA